MEDLVNKIRSAKPGDTVRISLRGPCSEDELEEMRAEHEKTYPGVNFEFTYDDDSIGVEILRKETAHGNANDG